MGMLLHRKFVSRKKEGAVKKTAPVVSEPVVETATSVEVVAPEETIAEETAKEFPKQKRRHRN